MLGKLDETKGKGQVMNCSRNQRHTLRGVRFILEFLHRIVGVHYWKGAQDKYTFAFETILPMNIANLKVLKQGIVVHFLTGTVMGASKMKYRKKAHVADEKHFFEGANFFCLQLN